MLELILKLYSMYMRTDVRSPLPHLIGPPGCGKSTVVEQAAEIIGKRLHIINVSRLSPLELEGVQMPHTNEDQTMYLKLLHATFWTALEEGDIVLFDEFLRGFPEVYNGLLDIFTARQVGGLELPRVFIIGASNSNISYDKALEDRLLHLPVPDPRTDRKAKKFLAQLIVDELGLLPDMRDSIEMTSVLDIEVLPMYSILDSFKNKTASPSAMKGASVRNLIGQAKLREVQSAPMRELISMNNNRAIQAGKPQFVLLLGGKNVDSRYQSKATVLRGNPKLTEIQAQNLELSLQLIEMEEVRRERGNDDDLIDAGPDDEIFG